MNGRRAIVGLCMFCALLLSAFAAQGASAASNGTTAFTCVSTPGSGTFKAAHCKPSDAGGTGFTHVEVAENTTTEVSITSEKTNAGTTAATPTIFKAVVGGVELKLESTEVHGTGTMENKKDPTTGEHYIEGIANITYTNVKDVGPSACEVYTDVGVGEPDGEKGVVHAEVVMTTKGQGDSIKFTPVGANFAQFNLRNCKNAGINNTYKVIGSATCKPDGATINCNHAELTTAKTLRLQSAVGPVAGYESSVTVSARAKGGGAFTPLSVTTKETT